MLENSAKHKFQKLEIYKKRFCILCYAYVHGTEGLVSSRLGNSYFNVLFLVFSSKTIIVFPQKMGYKPTMLLSWCSWCVNLHNARHFEQYNLEFFADFSGGKTKYCK